MPTLSDENTCRDTITLVITYQDLSPPPSWATVVPGPPPSIDYDGSYTTPDVGTYNLRVTGTDDNCAGSANGNLATYYDFTVTI